MNNAFQQPKKILLNGGEEIELPRLTLGKINAVAGSIAVFIKAVREYDPNLSFDWQDIEKNPSAMVVKLLTIIPAVLPVFSKEIIAIIAAYLNREKSWVEDNMDLEDLAQVVTPFLTSIFKQGNALFAVIGSLMKSKPETEEKTEEAPKQ